MRSARTLPAALLAVLALTGCSSPAARLPAGFPTAVPVVAGTIADAQHDRYEWHVWVAASDPVRTYRTARGELLARGYRETADSESSGGSNGQFCDPTWCVGLTGYRDPEHGESVLYVVARTSGMGAPLPL